VLKGNSVEGMIERGNTLIAFSGLIAGRGVRTELDPSQAFGFPTDMVISEKGTLSWNQDCTKVFFGIKEQEKEREKSDEPVADVDIFHWNDDRLQSVQKNRANTDRNFTYRSAFNVESGNFVRLADKKMRTVSVTRDGKWAVGQDQTDYVSDWQERRADFYRVDTDNGERTPMLIGHGRTFGLSPDSRYFLFWQEGQVWKYDLETMEELCLTEEATVTFGNAEYDHPGEQPAYGVTGWTADGSGVILRHRYDLWLQPLDGSAATNLTGGRGSEGEIVFRYVRTDPDQRFIDLSEPMLLSAYGQWTKKSGYYTLTNGEMQELIYVDKRFGGLAKAENADRYLYNIQDFREFPDYYVSDGAFANPKRVTDANPEDMEFTWGRRILFDYTNKAGVRLQGTLGIPDDYVEGQKLPMLVNFYEKNSQNLHRYPAPRYASSPQFAWFVSNGYLVMQPDVHFNTRTTADDMLDCVEAAVRKVIEMGYVDPARIGLHGHSFSGFGAAFISTRSKMFAAIIAGAAPINLVSEFNELFQGSGQNNHRYDIYGQGRYGTNPYDDFELYWSQSPISGVRNMDTPLLYLHGVDDPTVEYLQGMEFYNALRFNGKPVIFLSYPGEGHGLRRLENQKDFLSRMEQFYQHHLKGVPAPDWMEVGVPFLKKAR
jgi:dipeptidyl aminopeptidase/acylaminoacyl peptidase